MIWKMLLSMLAGAVVFAAGGTLFAASFDISQCEYRKFKVTSYYSPLAGQEFYYKGNYTDEVILNGKGTHGASGRAVFNGMIAAPATYPFGTKIYFPGRGIGQVEDRGGAIVEQGQRTDASYDRIDIWAGKGEDGLKRALSFGVQYLDGYICPSGVIGSQIGFDYDRFPSFENFFHQSLWVLELWPQRKDPWVGALQDFLIAMGYMEQGRSTSFYGNETKQAICAYQQQKIGLAKTHPACGWFGPQTRYAMKHHAKSLGLVDVNRTPLAKFLGQRSSSTTSSVQEHAGQVPVEIPPTLDERIIAHLFTDGEFKHYDFVRPFAKGEESKEIRILQRKLQRLGYLAKDATISGVYDVQTIEAIFAFQVEHGILTGQEDISIHGYFGEKTREAINGL